MDVFIFDRLHGLGLDSDEPLQRVMLVEFKKPGRKEYDERYSPLNQISRYITELNSNTTEDYKRERIRIAGDCVFYCYVVADIVGNLEMHTSSWRTTSNGRGRNYDLSGKHRGMIEIIEWKTSRSPVDTVHATTEMPIARFQAPSTPIQVAWRQLRAHHHGRRENQIPIALAAQPASNFPRLRAWRFLDAGRLSARRASSSRRPKTCTTTDIRPGRFTPSRRRFYALMAFFARGWSFNPTLSSSGISVSYGSGRPDASWSDHPHEDALFRQSPCNVAALQLPVATCIRARTLGIRHTSRQPIQIELRG